MVGQRILKWDEKHSVSSAKTATTVLEAPTGEEAHRDGGVGAVASLLNARADATYIQKPYRATMIQKHSNAILCETIY